MLVSERCTTTGLWIQPIDGKARRIELGNVLATAPFWLDASVGPKGEIALTGSEPGWPAAMYYLASPDSKPERLTDFNRDTAALELGKSETIHWDCDAFHMDGVVTYPPDFAAGRKYPLVLYIHGGPRSASRQAFSSRAQLLAAQGWIVSSRTTAAAIIWAIAFKPRSERRRQARAACDGRWRRSKAAS